jgi:hypothetical protein
MFYIKFFFSFPDQFPLEHVIAMRRGRILFIGCLGLISDPGSIKILIWSVLMYIYTYRKTEFIGLDGQGIRKEVAGRPGRPGSVGWWHHLRLGAQGL